MKDLNEKQSVGGLQICGRRTTVGQKSVQNQNKEVNSSVRQILTVNSEKVKPVNKLDGFNCMYANADSLPNKLDELKARVQ